MANTSPQEALAQKLTFDQFRDQVLRDYRTACESREASLIGRKEVLTGKAKFGIFGDGKEVAQVALARAMRPGDYKAGYYRDQTFMFATGASTIQQFFAQLYADPSLEADPFSGGRQMNAHFASRFLDAEGNWTDRRGHINVAADTSPTASQMARSLGLALASKCYRSNEALREGTLFSNHGNELTVVTIGDASTSEGLFWETVNAAGVQRVPLAICVWDDGYGISVPKEYQTTKGNISEVLEGFRVNEKGQGLDIYTVNGWDYPALCEMFERGLEKMRREHIPALFHVEDLTQPQGHSTSGSQERYKTPERLAWEKDHDCLQRMRAWLLGMALASEEELQTLEQDAQTVARDAQKRALAAFQEGVIAERAEAFQVLDALAMESPAAEAVSALRRELAQTRDPMRRDVVQTVRRALHATRGESSQPRKALRQWLNRQYALAEDRFHSHLYSQSAQSALKVAEVPAVYGPDAAMKNGFEILNTAFRLNFERDPTLYAFGEDLGHIGDVNQGFAGLQDVFGMDRIFDTGIREATIIGQGLGMAMRGLRPIAEIQYLDYLIYGLQPLTDELATLHYRTRGGQKAPLIVRTRGHRLEGIWHTGSPIGMILHSLRGVFVLVPRNMVQAVGMYNTMLRSDDPALIIECLNGYRLKERQPDNLGEFTVPLGRPEVLRPGTDLTLVTYGSCVRIAQEACTRLEEFGVDVELIDVQTLLPFDLEHRIAESVRKTNRLLVLDEDVPGGASAYILQQAMEGQELFRWLDSAPETLTAAPHRTPYGSDGDYFSKPSADDVFEKVYRIMSEAEPGHFPGL